ncbi:MAG: DUF479 domain-containing protein [Flavobacteriales bacterium]|nr:DUF479 domain-containing protein [Flavobacteriales bacterium]MCB9193684.1 DUF479 domain-containing protein [Flavobacteriales bacterium]
MNFLGHLFLSGDRPLVIVGNFMADAVKGRDLERFAPGVRQGIRLHRTIDRLTDAHPAALAGRRRLRAHTGKYAGVVLDLFYDHLLARDWNALHDEPLDVFTARMYAVLGEHRDLMEGRPARMLPYMIAEDWLSAYGTWEGLSGALAGLSQRATKGAVMRGAEVVLRTHYAAYRKEFLELIRDVDEATRDMR